jgi:hypothetical protein
VTARFSALKKNYEQSANYVAENGAGDPGTAYAAQSVHNEIGNDIIDESFKIIDSIPESVRRIPAVNNYIRDLKKRRNEGIKDPKSMNEYMDVANKLFSMTVDVYDFENERVPASQTVAGEGGRAKVKVTRRRLITTPESRRIKVGTTNTGTIMEIPAEDEDTLVGSDPHRHNHTMKSTPSSTDIDDVQLRLEHHNILRKKYNASLEFISKNRNNPDLTEQDFIDNEQERLAIYDEILNDLQDPDVAAQYDDIQTIKADRHQLKKHLSYDKKRLERNKTHEYELQTYDPIDPAFEGDDPENVVPHGQFRHTTPLEMPVTEHILDEQDYRDPEDSPILSEEYGVPGDAFNPTRPHVEFHPRTGRMLRASRLRVQNNEAEQTTMIDADNEQNYDFTPPEGTVFNDPEDPRYRPALVPNPLFDPDPAMANQMAQQGIHQYIHNPEIK